MCNTSRLSGFYGSMHINKHGAQADKEHMSHSHHRSSTSEGGEDACDEQSKRSIWGWQTDWGNVWLTDHSQGRLFSKVIKDLWPHFPALHLNCRSMAKKKRHVYEHTAACPNIKSAQGLGRGQIAHNRGRRLDSNVTFSFYKVYLSAPKMSKHTGVMARCCGK